ncbi:hypothetical protein [Gracilibacillus timonensis]|uniref:hypothetical protein n=1 Tax=Gracilibacillus timonensis TaxID=1816696 RepID=UPI000826CD8F|nr:hypothetical protein [Gracilibacillus timonensis]
MAKLGRIDLLLIGLLLIVSSIFSYFQGYIEIGLGFIIIIPGAYLVGCGIFDKPKEKPIKGKGLWLWDLKIRLIIRWFINASPSAFTSKH